MPEDRTAADRLDALEERVAHQDMAIDDLNATVMAQWGRIDALLRQVAALGDRLKEAESRAATGTPVPPPPHY